MKTSNFKIRHLFYLLVLFIAIGLLADSYAKMKAEQKKNDESYILYELTERR